MDTDRAYLFGLIIGGGNFGDSEAVLRIKLSLNKWGSYIENPQRAGQIANDILTKVGPMFRAIYNLSVQYETSKGGTWVILCEGDITHLKEDLAKHGIISNGEVKRNVDLDKFVSELVDDNMKRRFVAGIADTIGSLRESQRRFDNEHQTISLEISGYNYKFVCSLCHLLYSINCIPDQVNWNHPNIHSTKDCYFKQWNKGFKLRILLDQYAKFGAFAFRTKAESMNENRKLQQETHSAEKCEIRDFNVTPSTIHPAENDERLPNNIYGGHYIHFRHFCAVLGCEHAPYKKIEEQLSNIGELINPFPIICKRKYPEIRNIIETNALLSKRKYSTTNINVMNFVDIYITNKSQLLYGDNVKSGYPINEIMQGIAYILAYDNELKGSRTKGDFYDLIIRHLEENKNLYVKVHKPDILTPLILTGNGKEVLIGAKNPDIYRNLISFDSNNKYKVIVRQITEEDLKNA